MDGVATGSGASDAETNLTVRGSIMYESHDEARRIRPFRNRIGPQVARERVGSIFLFDTFLLPSLRHRPDVLRLARAKCVVECCPMLTLSAAAPVSGPHRGSSPTPSGNARVIVAVECSSESSRSPPLGILHLRQIPVARGAKRAGNRLY